MAMLGLSSTVFLTVITIILSVTRGEDLLNRNSRIDLDAESLRIRRNSPNVEDRDEEANVGLKDDAGGTLLTSGVPQKGPLLFYDGKSFLMELGSPVEVSVFRGGDTNSAISVVLLDREAISVKGSMIDANQHRFQVNLDWKQQNFGSTLRLESIQINMEFVKKDQEYTLTSMEAVRLRIDNKVVVDNPLYVNTSNGYKVKAPIGMAFCCNDPGTFMPITKTASISNGYTVGVTLPKVKMQVFKLRLDDGVGFGPEWMCGELLSIGLWVGLLVTLFFALICFYGFSMLASIQTMDRFDQPKGKSIHVPQID